VFGLVFNIALGVLSRLMPQMQVYFVAVPLSIMIGFLILLIVVGAMMASFLGYVGGVLPELAPYFLRTTVGRRTRRTPNDPKTRPEAARRGARTRRRGQEPGGLTPGSCSRRYADLLSFSGSMSSAILTMLRGNYGECARHSGRRTRLGADHANAGHSNGSRPWRCRRAARARRRWSATVNPAIACLVRREPQARSSRKSRSAPA
jgi:hypothetical protein